LSAPPKAEDRSHAWGRAPRGCRHAPGPAHHSALTRAAAELPVSYREVVVLRELEGLSYAEIARAVRAPVGTVMSRLSRGRAELRAALARRIAKDGTDAV
jgi:RNA polymerase sigma-70 factor, ECF subfamily